MAWWKRAPRKRISSKERRSRVILTAEGLRLPLTLATRGSRVGALLIDLTLAFMTVLLTGVTLAYVARAVGIDHVKQTNPGVRHIVEALQVLWIIALFVVPNAWFLWFELGARGATPGKRLLKLVTVFRLHRQCAFAVFFIQFPLRHRCWNLNAFLHTPCTFRTPVEYGLNTRGIQLPFGKQPVRGKATLQSR